VGDPKNDQSKPSEDATAALEAALFDTARQAREQAYAPYSHFQVGAALRTHDGRIFAGCNVENVSYGLSNCADRTALFHALARGCPAGSFSHLAVVGDTDAPITPCGACRQVLLELGGPDLVVIQASLHGAFTTTTAGALLPDAFRLS
jgi:cytidine deaminase